MFLSLFVEMSYLLLINVVCTMPLLIRLKKKRDQLSTLFQINPRRALTYQIRKSAVLISINSFKSGTPKNSRKHVVK